MALKEDTVLQAAEDHKAQHIFRVHETILRHVDADFLLRCITHEKIDSDNTSSYYSKTTTKKAAMPKTKTAIVRMVAIPAILPAAVRAPKPACGSVF